jgi:hypothetical protein
MKIFNPLLPLFLAKGRCEKIIISPFTLTLSPAFAEMLRAGRHQGRG